MGTDKIGSDPSVQQDALQKAREAQAAQQQESTQEAPAPEETKPEAVKPKSVLETQAPGQTGKPADSSAAEDLPIANPESTNPKADAAWGSMGATAQSNSGPKAVPGSENVIDTPEEEAHQDLKRQVAQAGIRDALAQNGAPEAQLDALTQSVMDKMFTGKGETPGGNIGFALAEDGGIVHKDASGKEYYEFGIGGEGSSIDLNGDGQNDSGRQYFKVDKAAVDGSTVPFLGGTDGNTATPFAADAQAPVKMPSAEDLAKFKDQAVDKIKSISDAAVKNSSTIAALSALAGPSSQALVSAGLIGLGALQGSEEKPVEPKVDDLPEVSKLKSSENDTVVESPGSLDTTSSAGFTNEQLAELNAGKLDELLGSELLTERDQVLLQDLSVHAMINGDEALMNKLLGPDLGDQANPEIPKDVNRALHAGVLRHANGRIFNSPEERTAWIRKSYSTVALQFASRHPH